MTATHGAACSAPDARDYLHDIGVQRSALKIRYVRERSNAWSRARLRHLVSRPLSNADLLRVELRRRELAKSAPLRLHPSYATIKDDAAVFKVTPDSISIPPVYGHVLYSLVAGVRPSLSLESGSGLGISGMYVCSAIANIAGSRFVSFEIADYFEVARMSVGAVCPDARIENADFNRFADFLAPRDAVSFAFLDAKHTADEVLRSYKALRGWLEDGAVVVFDDVGYSDDASKLWRELAREPEVSFAALVNERLGVLVR